MATPPSDRGDAKLEAEAAAAAALQDWLDQIASLQIFFF
jgi:hypothetical protein